MSEMIKSDGAVIHFDRHGPARAPTIVLIEGLSAHMVAWREEFFAHFVDAGFSVLRLDNRDVGHSQHYPGQSYELRDMAQDVHDLITHLEIAPVHVVGQSMGGMIAQHLAVEHPEDVASLTLIYTAGSAGHINSAERGLDKQRETPRARNRQEAIELHIEQERACASTAYSFDEAWKRELGGIMWDRNYDPDGVLRQTRAVTRHEMTVDELSTIVVPTLVIHGTTDALIAPTAGEQLHETIPNSQLWMIEGMGHDLPRELWPDITRRILANAIKGLDRLRAVSGDQQEATPTPEVEASSS